MVPQAAQTDIRRALFGRLIDHAALFPPASMSVPDAAAEDRRARESPYAWMLDRFICPASKLEALREQMPWETAPGLSVVLDGAGGASASEWPSALAADAGRVAEAMAAGAPVEAVELRLPAPRPESAALLSAHRTLRPLGVEAYFELVPGERWRDTVPAAIGAVAGIGGRVKLRCGGESAAAFPPVELVALVIASARQAGVAFKATAGLHHPVRHVEPGSGFPMHGFLNLLAASAFAGAGAARARELEAVLAEEDPAAFRLGEDSLAVAGLEADASEVAGARRALFTGYGSCSWSEPVEDLRRLGVLA
jgi:hypothetical protein